MLLTLFGCKVPIWYTDIFKFSGRRIQDFDIGGDIAISVNFCELVEMLVADFRDIEFVVSNGKDIILDVLKDGIC